MRIPVPLTQDELGQLVGTSRESVARALTFLGRKGFVLHRRKSYTVVDLEGLADYGQWSEPPSGLRPIRDPVAFEFSMTETGKRKPSVIEEVSGFWASLSDRQQDALVEVGRILQFDPGDDLCRQGDSAENILVIREGAPEGGGGAEIPALSQAELASCVDVSKETVSRVFKEWREQGVVETGRRRTIVLDVGRLREHASPPSAR